MVSKIYVTFILIFQMENWRKFQSHSSDEYHEWKISFSKDLNSKSFLWKVWYFFCLVTDWTMLAIGAHNLECWSLIWKMNFPTIKKLFLLLLIYKLSIKYATQVFKIWSCVIAKISFFFLDWSLSMLKDFVKLLSFRKSHTRFWILYINRALVW